MDNQNPDVHHQIEESFKDKTKYEGFLVYADKQINRKFNKGDKNRLRFLSPYDILSEVTLKIITGERKWDKKKYPNFEHFILTQIRSITSNEFHKAENKQMVLKSDSDKETIEAMEEYESPELGEMYYLDFELSKKIDEILEQDTECALVYECMRKRMKNAEIAHDLKISVREVVNIRKRIKYKLQNSKIFEKIKLQQ